jgi:hypothetical protein
MQAPITPQRGINSIYPSRRKYKSDKAGAKINEEPVSACKERSEYCRNRKRQHSQQQYTYHPSGI